MATDCDAELCQYWTGHGCACEVFDIDRDEREDEAEPFLMAGEKPCKGCGFNALVDTDGMCHDCYDGGAPIYV